MALPIYLAFEDFEGDGTLDTYPFDFKIYDKSELMVVVLDASGDVDQELTGDDTTYLSDVTFDSVNGGGEVVLQAVLPASYKIYLFLAPEEPVQPSEFANARSFDLKRIERAIDRVAGYVQRAFFMARNAVRLHDVDAAKINRGIVDFDARFPIDLVDNTDDLVPVVAEGGWAPLSSWLAVNDILAAMLSTPASTVPQILGSVAVPQSVTASLSFTTLMAYWEYRWYMSGTAGPITVTDIGAGNSVGQRITIFVPAGANQVTIPDSATRFNLNGDWVGAAGRALCVEWNGTDWYELWRR